jgi:hypothetical protein
MFLQELGIANTWEKKQEIKIRKVIHPQEV